MTTPSKAALTTGIVLLIATGCSAPISAHEDGGDDGAGSDADSRADGDADSDGDAEAGGGDPGEDAPSWDPLAGCAGGETDERWLVMAHGDGLWSFLTGRDCSDPRPLCRNCAAAAFSPSGRLAAVFVSSSTADTFRIFDEILVVDLETPDYPVVHRGFFGAQVAWVDDDRLLYVAPPVDWEGSCSDPAPPARPETVELRERRLSTGEERVVAPALRRSWATCCPIVSADGRRLAIAEALAPSCDATWSAVSVVDLSSGDVSPLTWSVEATDAHLDAPAGLLPDGSGFLVQTLEDGARRTSMLYATSYDGALRSVAGPIPAWFDWSLPFWGAAGLWGHCVTTRRIGPACEVYCRDETTGGWLRRRLVDGAEERVDCSTLGSDVRIMDVLQVPTSGR